MLDKVDKNLLDYFNDYSDSERQKIFVNLLVEVAEGFNLTETKFLTSLSSLSKNINGNNILSLEDIQLSLVKDLYELDSVKKICRAPLVTNEVKPDILNENWFSKLNSDELVEVDGKQKPLLAGLRRLAKPLIKSETSYVNHIGIVSKEVRRLLKKWRYDKDGKQVLVGAHEVIGKDNMPYASVTFSILLKDGREFTDSADAFLGNCDELGNYPTAVASARAEGRVLRKILDIKEHIFEELSNKDAAEQLTTAEDVPIAPEQRKMIEKLLGKTNDTTLREVLEKVAVNVTDIGQLTSAQATTAIRYLNDQKKKDKK